MIFVAKVETIHKGPDGYSLASIFIYVPVRHRKFPDICHPAQDCRRGTEFPSSSCPKNLGLSWNSV
jgi:hypothetical protein